MLRRLFNNPAIPPEYRSNFILLFWDIGWFGILAGSAVNFLNVYATRLGASGFQIGLLAAVPAVVTLIFAIPAGGWLEKRAVGKAVAWGAVLNRACYLLWIPLPWLFGNQGQIWSLIILALVMGLPLTVVTVGFNALFAAAVPSEWRAYVAGMRNIVYAVAFVLSSLGSGYLLDHVPFPIGYQIVFGIGFLGAMLSSYQLFFIKTFPIAIAQDLEPAPAETPRPRRGWIASLRLDIWRGPFAAILLSMLFFHLTQYMAFPLFPIYMVRVIHLTDAQIGMGTALFYLTMLISSTQLGRLVRKIGNHKVTAWGVVFLCLYPILMAFSKNAAGYYMLSTIGGLVWGMLNGAYANYLLEHIPAHDRPAHLAWYNVVLNAGILIGSLAAPELAKVTGLVWALIIIGSLRFLAGLALLRWGNPARGPERTAAGTVLESRE
jgi:MFS family permease